jgi:ribosome maturation factor RimP
MEVKEKIIEWITPYITEHDLFLVDVKIQGGKKVEVFVDSDEGIKISQCAEISRLLESHLDGSGLVSEHYMLDVSSPGMSNPLKVLRQYKRRIDRELSILKTDGTTLDVVLKEVKADSIIVEKIVSTPKGKKKKKEAEEAVTNLPFEIQFSDIKKATLILKW